MLFIEVTSASTGKRILVNMSRVEQIENKGDNGTLLLMTGRQLQIKDPSYKLIKGSVLSVLEPKCPDEPG